MIAVILTIFKKNLFSWSSFQTVRNDIPSTGWCYTMLQPLQSLPLSSDTAGKAKTRREEELERERERQQSGKSQQQRNRSRGVAADICSFLIGFGIRHPCEYSRKGSQRTRAHLKEFREWVRQPSKLCERGHKRSLSRDPTAVVFQCQIVPRTCCQSTPSICIYGPQTCSLLSSKGSSQLSALIFLWRHPVSLVGINKVAFVGTF